MRSKPTQSANTRVRKQRYVSPDLAIQVDRVSRSSTGSKSYAKLLPSFPIDLDSKRFASHVTAGQGFAIIIPVVHGNKV